MYTHSVFVIIVIMHAYSNMIGKPNNLKSLEASTDSEPKFLKRKAKIG
jgi:hypothetical protein